MPIVPIPSLSDPRVAPYRNLKDRDLAREGDRFIAESEHVVRRLIESDFPIESVLLEERRAEEIAPLVPPGIPIYVAPKSLMTQILGFKFHSGVIACARRKPSATLEQIASAPDATIVVCPDLNNAENLGSIIRIASGFGASGILLGPHCVDPFWRLSIRVSMGNVFKLPIVRSNDLISDLHRLYRDFAVETFATILDESAESLENVQRPPKIALLFGGEAHGLAPEVVAACRRRVTIPMKLGTDSLNVSVTAGIFLYHFTHRTPISTSIVS
jgi:tRNA G18 (ribose-2'-O)-methylase SpoU